MPHAYSSQIRAMRLEDLDAVLAVQAACYPPSMQEAAAVLRARMRAAGDSCVVAEDGNGMCGYLFAYPSRLGLVTPLGAEFAPACDADTLYLHDLAVAPRAHGRGLARRMAGHLLEQAHARGFAWSALVSVQDTAGFWSALGYRIEHAACPAALTALASYPGLARYMVRTLTGPGAPSPNC
ncbi:GNAT family N-acetyltransferase [Massilia sp. LjRoot122]|uniref:GNAT family N-acetyltransferase n=1 Tax=Massilia sp. LjRoot122 TaxID=3342257 RepID=UPI003ECC71F1